MADQKFVMPVCDQHLFRGYKWWCRHCRTIAERQFREVCVAYWALRKEAQ